MSGPADPGAAGAPGFVRAATAAEACEFFERLWADSDPWQLDASQLDQQRYERQLELVAGRRYDRALEIGCAGGSFTRRLSPLCDELIAIDISEEAVARARGAGGLHAGTELRVANVMDIDFEAEGDWDLIVLAETAYYLGWLYPMFEVGWLAHSLFQATRPGGRLLLTNTISSDTGLMSPWLIATYHDLFRNVGYEVETDTRFMGTKESVEFEIRLTLLRSRRVSPS